MYLSLLYYMLSLSNATTEGPILVCKMVTQLGVQCKYLACSGYRTVRQKLSAQKSSHFLAPYRRATATFTQNICLGDCSKDSRILTKLLHMVGYVDWLSIYTIATLPLECLKQNTSQGKLL